MSGSIVERAIGNQEAKADVLSTEGTRHRGSGMHRASVPIALIVILGLIASGCSPASAAGDPLTEVRAALSAAGLSIVSAEEQASSGSATFGCLPQHFRYYGFDQEAPHPTFHPGEKPSVQVLAFDSVGSRQAAQDLIDPSGVAAGICAAMIDWVATPHFAGGGRYLLLVVTNDNALAATVGAAAARLGPP